MADSLREQLIAAGLASAKPDKKSAKPAKRSKKKSAARNAKSRQAAAQFDQAKKAAEQAAEQQIAEKKALKARIKALIEEQRLEKWQGETAYRYQVGSRLRELYVTPDVQKKLSARELAITRLNGATYVVPQTVADEIRTINPKWTVFNTNDPASEADPDTGDGDGYEDFQVPDDLTW